MTPAEYLRKIVTYNSLQFLTDKGRKELYDAVMACAEVVDGLDTRNNTTDTDWSRVNLALAALESLGKGK